MKKITAPTFEDVELYDATVADLPDPILRQKFQNNRNFIVATFNSYRQASTTKTWCNLQRVVRGHPEQVVAGDLRKAELVVLYDDGVIRSKGRPRQIYDQIKLSAHEECPYCGGIGDIGYRGELSTADHFLPKSRFPAYAVLPVNLVPACRVCNGEMSDSFPTLPHDQPIHPYLDDEHFFSDRWIFATIREEEPIVVDYFVAAPDHWSLNDRQRVGNHFDICKLGSRYRSRVPQEVMPLREQRTTSLKALSPLDFRNHLLSVANSTALPVNGWKRTLYLGLAASDWFCNLDH